jgi:hypothetical protein
MATNNKNATCCDELYDKLAKQEEIIKDNKLFTDRKNCFTTAKAFHETPQANKGKCDFKIYSKDEFCRIDLEAVFPKGGGGVSKTDYVYYQCNTKNYYFVELKGKDLSKAYKQIVATINYFKERQEAMQKSKVIAIIVHTKTTNKTTNLGKHNNEKDFKANYGKELIYKENGFEIRI